MVIFGPIPSLGRLGDILAPSSTGSTFSVRHTADVKGCVQKICKRKRIGPDDWGIHRQSRHSDYEVSAPYDHAQYAGNREGLKTWDDETLANYWVISTAKKRGGRGGRLVRTARRKTLG